MSTKVTPPSSPKVRIAPRITRAEAVNPAPIETSNDEEVEGKDLSTLFQDDHQQTVEDIANEAINTGNIDKVTVKNSKSIISFIHKKRLEAAKTSVFEVAQQCDDVVRAIMQKVSTIRMTQLQEEQYNDLDIKLTIAQNEYDDLKGRWEAVIAQAEKHKATELKNLQRENEEELARLDETYDGDPPSTFRKLSPRIIELRHTIRITAKSGNLKEADRLKQQCDAMEAEEKEQIRNDWRTFFRVTKNTLMQSLDQKYQLKVEQLDRDIIKMTRYKNSELLRAQRVIDHIKEKIALFEKECGVNSSERFNIGQRIPQTARTPRASIRRSGARSLRQGRCVISKPSTPRSKTNKFAYL